MQNAKVLFIETILLPNHILRYGRAHTLRVYYFSGISSFFSLYRRVQACLYRGICILGTILFWFYIACGMGEPIPYGFIIFPVYRRSFRFIVGYRLACTVEYIKVLHLLSPLFASANRDDRLRDISTLLFILHKTYCKVFHLYNFGLKSKQIKPQYALKYQGF